MRRFVKKTGIYLVAFLGIPYAVTMYLNGTDAPETSAVDTTSVRVSEETELPLQEYGIGVLAKEMPGDYEKEAFKAQAVLVRTAICKKLEEEGSHALLKQDYLNDAQKKELWGDRQYYAYYKKLKQAWEETDGEILTWKNKPAYAPFCRLTNGSTREAKEALGEEFPYLKIVDCPKDLKDEWQIQTKIIKNMDARVISYDSTGYVKKVKVGQKVMSGETFRKKYDLASSSFILQKYEGKLRIITRGVGHGLGMSQYTANEMAKKGKNYKEILNHFYKKIKIKEVAQICE